MKQLDDSQTALALKAAEHFEAYLRVMRRDNGPYVSLIDYLKRKEPASETPASAAPAVKKRKA